MLHPRFPLLFFLPNASHPHIFRFPFQFGWPMIALGCPLSLGSRLGLRLRRHFLVAWSNQGAIWNSCGIFSTCGLFYMKKQFQRRSRFQSDSGHSISLVGWSFAQRVAGLPRRVQRPTTTLALWSSSIWWTSWLIHWSQVEPKVDL